MQAESSARAPTIFRRPARRRRECVNALTEWFKAEVYRDGQIHTIGFERGKTTQPLDVVAPSRAIENRHPHYVFAGPGDIHVT